MFLQTTFENLQNGQVHGCVPKRAAKYMKDITYFQRRNLHMYHCLGDL